MPLPCMEDPKLNVSWGCEIQDEYADNEDVNCNCDAIQNPNHLLVCPMFEEPCGMEDKATAAANYW